MDIELSQEVAALLEQAVRAQLQGDRARADTLYGAFAEQAVESGAPLYEYGVLLRNLGRPRQAERLLAVEMARTPEVLEVGYERGLALLGLGEYRRGWPLYEQRRAIPQFHIQTPTLTFPEWRGEPLSGRRIVLFPEQGLGDNIQFARFALTLRDQGAQVLLLCRPPLERLLRRSLEGVEVRAAQGSVDLGEPDFWAHFGSLPGLLGLTLETIPDAPYLDAAAPHATAGETFRIGLMTQGASALANDVRRSLGPQDARRLAALPGQVVSLQPGDSGARDFADTADLVAGLDLVVTVDTSVAHLAGAMGKPAFVLIPGFGADWRWLQDRDSSPWYPSLTLFRGRVDGLWDDAIARLEAAVAERSQAKAPLRAS